MLLRNFLAGFLVALLLPVASVSENLFDHVRTGGAGTNYVCYAEDANQDRLYISYHNDRDKATGSCGNAKLSAFLGMPVKVNSGEDVLFDYATVEFYVEETSRTRTILNLTPEAGAALTLPLAPNFDDSLSTKFPNGDKPQGGTPPSGWQVTAIGDATCDVDEVSAGVISVNASGTLDMTDLCFVHKTAATTDDLHLEVCVGSYSGHVGTWTGGGLAIREGTASSDYFSHAWIPDTGRPRHKYGVDGDFGVDWFESLGPNGLSAPLCLGKEYNDTADHLSGWYSTDSGVTWGQIGSNVSKTLTFPVEYGFFLTSQHPTNTTTVQFTDVVDNNTLSFVDEAPPEPDPDDCGYLPIVPGLCGYGTQTTAGRGGTIIEVTNLNNSGAGSLRACVEATGARVCVFETSGRINLSSNITISSGNIHIAGQTAPSPGVIVTGGGLIVSNANDVFIEHITLAVGDASSGPAVDDRDSFRIQNIASRIVLKNMGLYWGVDETGSAWVFGSSAAQSDITVVDSIIAEALNNILKSPSAGANHSKGFIAGAQEGRVAPTNVLFLRNLFAHNFERNPLTEDTVSVNNYIYNWQYKGMEVRGSMASSLTRSDAAIVGNYFKAGPNTNSVDNTKRAISLLRLSNASEIYLSDNAASWFTVTNQNQLAHPLSGTTTSQVLVGTAPFFPQGLTALSVGAAQTYVLANAGPRPGDRDAVAARFITEATNGTGSARNCIETCTSPKTTQVSGGWPTFAVNTNTFTPVANPHDVAGNGYTNLQNQLRAAAEAIE